MLRRLLLTGLLSTTLFPAAVPAAPPTREPIPTEATTITGFCDFDVVVTPIQSNVTLTAFTNAEGEIVKMIATGVIRLGLANADTGASTIVNVSGPTQVGFSGGEAVVTAVGPWIHTVDEPGLHTLLQTRGRIVLGDPIATLRGTSVDLCAVLAKPS